MRFSIIIATINRTEENLRLLKSIAAQQYNDIEVIYADQNNDDRLNPILAQYRLLFPILHLRSQKGLSRSRNEALAFAQGEIICFPDDDCWYPPILLPHGSTARSSKPTSGGNPHPAEEVTIAKNLRNLRLTLQYICPGEDWSWLLTIINRIAAQAKHKPEKHHLVTSETLYALGIELMDGAIANTDAAGKI